MFAQCDRSPAGECCPHCNWPCRLSCTCDQRPVVCRQFIDPGYAANLEISRYPGPWCCVHMLTRKLQWHSYAFTTTFRAVAARWGMQCPLPVPHGCHGCLCVPQSVCTMVMYSGMWLWMCMHPCGYACIPVDVHASPQPLFFSIAGCAGCARLCGTVETLQSILQSILQSRNGIGVHACTQYAGMHNQHRLFNTGCMGFLRVCAASFLHSVASPF